MMRDCAKNRAGFDRVLMTVAATFLTVSATSALAQPDLAQRNAAELAIEAAVPRPEPANLPPPTINDFKPDTATATTPGTAQAPKADTAKVDNAKATDHPAAAKPADVAVAPAADISNPALSRTRPKIPRPRERYGVKDAATPSPAATAAQPAAEPVKAASNVPAADQPVADKLRDMLGEKSSRYFDRKVERMAVEKFYTARDFAPLWTQAGTLTATGQGRDRTVKGCGLRRLEPRRLPGTGFRRGNEPGWAGGSRSETDREYAGLCPPGPERTDALVAAERRCLLSGTSDRSFGSAQQRQLRQGRLHRARQLQPAAKALSRTESQARRIARPG